MSATLSTTAAYRRGLRESAPLLVVIIPFGMLFGIVASEAGLDLLATMSLSALVVAGAAQFTVVQLFSENAPTLVIIATALAVNLRLAMYSAAMAPYLGNTSYWMRGIVAYTLVDQSFAMCTTIYARYPGMSMSARLAYYFGVSTNAVVPWVIVTWIGATMGDAIPQAFALDFALPITFLALIGPMLRTLPHVAAALVSVAGSLLLAGVPYNLGLLIAAAFAMLAGAQTELWQERKRAP